VAQRWQWPSEAYRHALQQADVEAKLVPLDGLRAQVA
jgi:hypothetical protein